MVFVYGFAGLRDYNGELCFCPALPEALDCIRFKLTFRGQSLEIDVGQDETRYTLTTGNGLTIRHETKEICLSPTAPTVVLPNSKPSERADVKHRAAG